MSRIFETLNKGGGELADLIRPVVGVGPRAVTPNSATTQNDHGRGAGESGQPEKPEAGQGGTHWEGIRSLSIRIPAPSPLLPFEADQRRASEQYRILRTKLTQHRRQPRVILISSPHAGDGKSISAINTAATLSLKSRARVVLVDADLRRSAVHVLLGLPAAPGLSDVLQGRVALNDALVRTKEFPSLYVLTAGTTAANPAELLDSAQWPALCASLRQMFEFVMVDSPPVGAVADYDLIQAACDGAILVARPDHTNRDLLWKALESIPKEKLLGVLLNCVPDWPIGRYHGANQYYHYEAPGSAPGNSSEA